MCDVFFRIRCSSEYESLHIFPKMWKYIYIYIYHLLLEIFNFKQHCEDRLYMDFFSLKYYYRYSRF